MKQTVQTKLKATIKLLNLIKLKFLHSRNGFVAILVLPFVHCTTFRMMVCSALFAVNWCVYVRVNVCIQFSVCHLKSRTQFVQILPLYSFTRGSCDYCTCVSICVAFSVFKKNEREKISCKKKMKTKYNRNR